MVKRVVTGAHYGLKDWLVQRITAVIMAAYVVLFLGVMLACTPRSYDDWHRLFAYRPVRIATLVFFLSLLWHAWIGMRDILMDYVKPTGVRLALEVAVVLVLASYAAWAVQILWSV